MQAQRLHYVSSVGIWCLAWVSQRSNGGDDSQETESQGSVGMGNVKSSREIEQKSENVGTQLSPCPSNAYLIKRQRRAVRDAPSRDRER